MKTRLLISFKVNKKKTKVFIRGQEKKTKKKENQKLNEKTVM